MIHLCPLNMMIFLRTTFQNWTVIQSKLRDALGIEGIAVLIEGIEELVVANKKTTKEGNISKLFQVIR